MALLSEDFEGGTSGAAVTASNTAFDSFSGPPTFTTNAFAGSLAMRCNNTGTASNATANLSPQDAMSVRCAFWMDTEPAAKKVLINFYDSTGSGHLVGVRVDPSGTVDIRDGFTSRWSSSTSLATGTWYQVQATVDNAATTLSLALYDAAGTLIEQGSGSYSQAAQPATVKIGATQNNDTADWTVDAVVVDVTPPGPVVATPVGQVKAYDGTNWYPVKAWDGSTWRAVKAYDGSKWV